MSNPRILVAGASGYTGALASELVWNHPGLDLVQATSRRFSGQRICDLYPRYRVPLALTEPDIDSLENIDAAIVAYPHGAAAPLVAELRGLGIPVVDLSADFRLKDLDTYVHWYAPHGAPELLEGAVYGLTELNREQIVGASLVANPGCYPTASVLALAPILEAGLLGDGDNVIIDAKSGVSGAGREAGERMSFVSVTENFKPYGIEGHRHSPEIAQELSAVAGHDVTVTFIPHLLPVDQGMLATAYVTPRREITAAEVADIYRQRYDGEEFVNWVDTPPGIRDVRDTNNVHVHATVTAAGQIVAFAAVDNLWKGAAGQAIQNLNLMLGLPETAGLK